MEVKARIKNLRISPRKVRLVADLVRGKKTSDAIAQLRFTNKKSAKSISDVIKSGVANAENNFKLNPDNLYIKEIRVDKGLTLKRYQPRAFGRATMIQKKMSHVVVVLDEIEPSTPAQRKESEKGKAKDVAKDEKKSESKKEEPKKEKETAATAKKSAGPVSGKASKATASKLTKKNSTGKVPASRQSNKKTASSQATGKK